MSTTTDHLSTPALDSESPSLLQTISSHGGYAYVSMATLAVSGDSRAAEAAREMAWEQLHSGPWDSVLPVWRDAYSMACLQVAKFQYGNGELNEALRVLDLGLIMGGLLLKKDLEAAVALVSEKVREAQNDAVEKKTQLRPLLLVEDVDKPHVLGMLPMRSLSCKIVMKRTKWNDMDYLRKVAGDRTVPVEVGKNYLCPNWKQELITFSQFLERMHSNDTSSVSPTYLAQHPLFEQIKELRNDIFIPDYCFAGGGELRSLNAWFGPTGTVTPLHHDPHHNILAQVVGRKYIRLYSASLSKELYPYTETMLCNSSRVDLDNIDGKQFPKLLDLEFMDCILEEGEMLYIPPKWWHYVRSLTTSLSVSFWWSDNGSSTMS
ncbi:Cupin_8 domain-containing protein [Cephalotus follicularis]|uniref:Cupin_8 domain-containing protein n=1 Tax=Cephalotus follicularis TaxID=3775 RepID=A0A1Q3BVK5_CEPFO|nr:Cupin_8 domain-containing protein [Cephalotus follicularis]